MKRTDKKAGKLLSPLVRSFAIELGYKHEGPMELARADGNNPATWRLIFDPRGRPLNYSFAWSAGVTIERLAWLIWDEVEDFTRGTVGLPVHLLLPGQEPTEWYEFADQEQAHALLPKLLHEYRNYVLPFLVTYSAADELEAKLTSPDPKDWFVLNAERRTIVLAAIKYDRGAIDDAEKLLKDAMQERADAELKYRLPIQRALSRLAARIRGDPVKYFAR